MPGDGRAGRQAQVTVRMYREGLGDCFLLTFHGATKPASVLIDCGVILGTEDAAQTMTRVARDIGAATGGHLAAVVATHEHWDHLSGFVQAKDVFEKEIAMDEVWLPWTEEPGNPRARELKAEFGLRLQAVRQALQQWKGSGFQPRLQQGVADVFSFFGDGLGAAASTREALDRLTGRKDAEFRYLSPGQAFALPGVDGVRVYVLGPPSDEAFVRKLLPRKGSEDAYQMRLTPTRAFLAALEPRQADPAADEWRRLALPFDEYYMIQKEQALARPDDDFFRRHYGDAADAWRKIDDDWLTAAGQLALALDNWTNNMCLVLAFEIVATGDVLLFPGDAQIGNWESWQRVSFEVPDGNGGRRNVTARDLLQRTVFYKVGHHGSHNATHRAQGLELMTNPELVAMIPVNHAMATRKRWNMPFPPLLERLTEKCRSRVIRQDDAVGAAVAAAASTLANGQAARFRKRVRETDLYVECDFPP